MTKPSLSPMITTAGIALAISALAGGASLLITNNFVDGKINQALEQKLPSLVAKALSDEKAKALEAKRQKIMSSWKGAPDSTPNDRWVYGNLNAQFTLVEFSDLECPFCKRFHDTPKQLVDQSEGRISWEWQHYPLPFHNPAAATAAHAAECVGDLAGNKAFWAFNGEWFSRTQLNGQGVEDVDSLVSDLGIPQDGFKACMESGRFKQKIQQQADRGTALGVTGTPATAVVDNLTGNKLLVKGAVPPQAFLKTIEQLIQMREQKPNQEQVEAETPAKPEAGIEQPTDEQLGKLNEQK